MWRKISLSLLFVVFFTSVFHAAYCANDDSELLREKRDSKHVEWSYEGSTGPKHWPSMFHTCSGKYQSPIDIDLDAVDQNDELEEIEFIGYDKPLDDAKIKNNGHTIVVYPNDNDEKRYIDEGSLDDKFQFLQLHFHWGSDSKKGSEHTIEKERFPLEMHLVHRNTKYKTMEAATKKEDGLAVISVLFKIDDEDNEALKPIIEKLDDVRKEGAEATLDVELEELLPEDTMPYFRYRGSLTTPPCSEAVIWTIFKHFESISEKQLQQFRNVKEDEDPGEPEENLVDNFRDIQNIGSRIVEVSGEKSSGAISLSNASSLLFMMASMLLFGQW